MTDELPQNQCTHTILGTLILWHTSLLSLGKAVQHGGGCGLVSATPGSILVLFLGICESTNSPLRRGLFPTCTGKMGITAAIAKGFVSVK